MAVAELYQIVANHAEESNEPGIARDMYRNMIALGEARWETKAEGCLRRMNVLGHPLDLKFTAIDGRKVDLSALKGKVVLLDFWASWCGPCMSELPEVKRVYSRYHDKGFEIVGISLDDDLDKLRDCIKTNGITWPQYFDGKNWQNEISSRYGIHSIPAMWLIDKTGNVVSLDAREELDNKTKTLLDENKDK